MPHLRCAFRRSRFPPISNRFPIYDDAAPPARTTVYGLPSLAATNIASRTTFVVCVPIASAPPPSLQGQASFANAFRAITAFSVPHSVAQGRVPTPSGSCALRHGHPPRRDLRLYLRYRTASSRSHVHLPPRRKDLSACHSVTLRTKAGHATATHFRVARPERRSYCQRASPRLTARAARLRASGVLAVVRAAFRRTEHQLRKNANRPRNPRRRQIPPLRGEIFFAVFLRRNHCRNSPKTRAHYAQGVSTHARTCSCADGERTHWRVMHAHEGCKPSPRQAVPSRQSMRLVLRQAVKPSPPRHGTTPAALASRLAHYAHHTQRVTPRMRHAPRTRIMRTPGQRALCAHTGERGAPFGRAKCR